MGKIHHGSDHALSRRPPAVISFETLHPKPSVDGFSFCHGKVKPPDEVAAKIRAMAQVHGAAFIQAEEAGIYGHCFVMPAAIAEADPDFAASLV